MLASILLRSSRRVMKCDEMWGSPWLPSFRLCHHRFNKPTGLPLGSGNAALVRHLLKAKAEPSAGEDKLGRSPLSIAILANQKDAWLFQ